MALRGPRAATGRDGRPLPPTSAASQSTCPEQPTAKEGLCLCRLVGETPALQVTMPNTKASKERLTQHLGRCPVRSRKSWLSGGEGPGRWGLQSQAMALSGHSRLCTSPYHPSRVPSQMREQKCSAKTIYTASMSRTRVASAARVCGAGPSQKHLARPGSGPLPHPPHGHRALTCGAPLGHWTSQAWQPASATLTVQVLRKQSRRVQQFMV